MSRLPRIVPVVDICNGVAVWAVGGRRDEYRPAVSRLTPSTDPVQVAVRMAQAVSAQEVYVADLDAIMDQKPNRGVISRLASLPVPVWLDAGIRDLAAAAAGGACRLVLGTETVHGPETAADVVGQYGADRVALSIDLFDGRLLGGWERWGVPSVTSAVELAHVARRCGIGRFFVIDLCRVGVGSGVGTEAVCRAIREEHPEVELFAGGGVRTWDDVERLGCCGVDGVLMASAIHDGTLTLQPPAG